MQDQETEDNFMSINYSDADFLSVPNSRSGSRLGRFPSRDAGWCSVLIFHDRLRIRVREYNYICVCICSSNVRCHTCCRAAAYFLGDLVCGREWILGDDLSIAVLTCRSPMISGFFLPISMIFVSWINIAYLHFHRITLSLKHLLFRVVDEAALLIKKRERYPPVHGTYPAPLSSETPFCFHLRTHTRISIHWFYLMRTRYSFQTTIHCAQKRTATLYIFSTLQKWSSNNTEANTTELYEIGVLSLSDVETVKCDQIDHTSWLHMHNTCVWTIRLQLSTYEFDQGRKLLR